MNPSLRQVAVYTQVPRSCPRLTPTAEPSRSTAALGIPRSPCCRRRSPSSSAARRLLRSRHGLVSYLLKPGDGRSICASRRAPHAPASEVTPGSAPLAPRHSGPYQGEHFVGVGILALAARRLLRLLGHLHGRQHGHSRSLQPAISRPYPIQAVLVAFPRLLPVPLHGPRGSALCPPGHGY